MKSARHATALVAVLTLAAACAQEQNNGNAAQPTADQESVDANQMMADSDNPYGQAEMQMQERMMEAVGTDVSDTWVRKMIQHHQGAIDMSNILLEQGPEAGVRDMAQKTIEKQRKDIQDLEKLAQSGASGSSESAAPFQQPMMQMHDKMMAARGANASETWIRKMIEHHRGAVDMANVVLAQGPNPRVREMAQKTVKEQTKDISDLEKMLRGETTESGSAAVTAPAAGSTATTSASEPKAKAAAQPKARTSERAPKAATPAADPHEGMDMGNMANMSH